MKPQYLPLIPQIIADNPQTINHKTKNSLNLKQPVFVCEIMQLAAFLCVICAICGRITCKRTQSIPIYETPMSPADSADLRRQNPKPQNNINLTNLSFSAK